MEVNVMGNAPEERIQNGGFEDVSGVPWAAEGSGTGTMIIFPFAPHGGTFHLICDPDPGDMWAVTQLVNFTNVNTVTFWQGLADGLRVYLDDILLGTYESAVWDWVRHDIDTRGYTGTKTLKFAFGDTEWSFLDDISAYSEPKYWYDGGSAGSIGYNMKKCQMGRNR
jgi:hypothetical protein